MNFRKNALTTLAASAVMLMTSSAALGQPGMNMMHKHMRKDKPKMMQQFTPEQQTAVKEEMKNLMQKVRPQVEQMESKAQMLDNELNQPKVDQDKVNGLINDISDLRKQILQERINSIMDIKEKTGVTLPVMPKTERETSK